MELMIGAGREDMGLHATSYPCPALTTNAAIWAKRAEFKMWRLENVEGRVRRAARIDTESALHGDVDADEDLWISTRAIPKGWYEIEVAPLPGMTSPHRLFIEIERHGGPSYLARLMDDRARLNLIMIANWV